MSAAAPDCRHLHSVQGPGCPWCPPHAQDWREAAACQYVDPDLFHPDTGQPTRPAKAVCAACPVRVQCLEYALEAGERLGVWGGLGPDERAALTRDRAAGRAA